MLLQDKENDFPNESFAVGLKEDKDKDKDKDNASVVKPVKLRELFRYTTPLDRLVMIVAAIVGIANGAAYPLMSILFGEVSDQLNDPTSDFLEVGIRFSKYFAYLTVFTLVSSTIQWFGFSFVASRMTFKMRREYLNSLLCQEIGFFDEHDSGELSSALPEHIMTIKRGLSEKFGLLFQYTSMFVVGLGVGLYYGWQLTLVVLACLPLIVIGGYLEISVVGEGEAEKNAAYAKAGAVAEESIRLIRTVLSFGGEAYMSNKYDEHLKEAEKVGIKKAWRRGMATGVLMGSFFLTYAPVFYFGALFVKRDREDAAASHPPSLNASECAIGEVAPLECQIGDPGLIFSTMADVCACSLCECGCFDPSGEPDCFTAGDVILVFLSVIIAGMGLGAAIPSFELFMRARLSMGKVFEIIDRVPLVDMGEDKGEKLNLSEVRGEIKYENVSFAYPTRRDSPIFSNLNMDVKAGETVALVGGSGSGKSTAFQLFLRNYNTDSGRILLDGKDIAHLNLISFRNVIGLVSQEPVLFAATIAENIAFGKPGGEATREEIEQAAKQANAHDFIMEFPEGYDTHAGQAGSLLSGGQKQRIAIARAIVRDPKILMLDEATSALDRESERVVQAALDELLSKRNRTTLIISHRLSTIRDANRIVVLDQGKIVEMGTFNELMETGGHFRALYEASKEGSNTSKSATDDPKQTLEIENDTDDEDDFNGEDLEAGKGDAKVGLSHPEHPGLDQNARMSSSSSYALSQGKARRHRKRKTKEKPVPMSRLLEYVKPERLWFIPGVFFAAVNGAKEPIMAILFTKVFVTLYLVNQSKMIDEASFYALIFLALSTLAFFGAYGQYGVFGYLAEKLTTRLRSHLFRSLLHQDVEFFDNPKNTVGAIGARLANDAALVKAPLTDRVGILVSSIAALLTGLAIGFAYGWELTLALCAVLPFVVFAAALEYYLQAVNTDDKEGLARAGHVLTEAVIGIRTVSAFNLRERVVGVYNEHLKGPEVVAIRKGAYSSLAYGFSQGMQFVMYVIAFRYGAELIVNGSYDFEALFAVQFALLMTGLGMGQAAQSVPEVAQAKLATIRVFRFIDKTGKINGADPNQGIKFATPAKGNIVFNHVTFAYPSRKQIEVFKDLTLKIKAGQTVALVGQSGSGKSTITALTDRFYDPISGSIGLDQHDLRSLNVASLREQIGFVMQEPSLFTGTIAENIAFGKRGAKVATKEEIYAAAKSANCYDFIQEFPQGFETMVGENKLSGGQKQRIAIARALIRNPSVLLLDEATSALDNKSERVVQEALDDLIEKRKGSGVIIIIAHRLSTVRNADKIIVFDHGTIVEQGTHEELLQKNGAYALLYSSQETSSS